MKVHYPKDKSLLMTCFQVIKYPYSLVQQWYITLGN